MPARSRRIISNQPPMPFVFPPIRNPKVLSLVTQARSARGVHSYFRDGSYETPISGIALFNLYFPDQTLKITNVNYINSDNHVYGYTIGDGTNVSMSIELKEHNVSAKFSSPTTKKSLKLPKKVVLNRGDYIISSITCTPEGPSTCEDQEKCNEYMHLKFTFNGTQIPGYIRAIHKELLYTFRLITDLGYGMGTISREMHWEYKNFLETMAWAIPEVPVIVGLDEVKLFTKLAYFYAGDTAVIEGTYRKNTKKYKGIALGVTRQLTSDCDMADFAIYRGTSDFVTFHVSVGEKATVISTNKEYHVLTKIQVLNQCLGLAMQNIEVLNFETYVAIWSYNQI
ncbi:uncharacterized protein [Dermacentor albipictus]|uniref:uncharacterized protein n=1 Tax=Dermacentor albipictus TaxID=60249 RepID=UPI0031FCF8A7